MEFERERERSRQFHCPMNINFINHSRAMMMTTMIHSRALSSDVVCILFLSLCLCLFAQKWASMNIPNGSKHWSRKVIYLIVYKIIISYCLIKCSMALQKLSRTNTWKLHGRQAGREIKFIDILFTKKLFMQLENMKHWQVVILLPRNPFVNLLPGFNSEHSEKFLLMGWFISCDSWFLVDFVNILKIDDFRTNTYINQNLFKIFKKRAKLS